MNNVGAREGIVWVIIGGLISLLSWRIDLGNFHEPGPGFIAFAAGVSLVVIGAIMILVRPASKETTAGVGGPKRKGRRTAELPPRLMRSCCSSDTVWSFNHWAISSPHSWRCSACTMIGEPIASSQASWLHPDGRVDVPHFQHLASGPTPPRHFALVVGIAMELFQNLFYGFGIALQPINLLTCFVGVFIGTLIGVLPGIGPVGAMSLLLPVTFGMSPVSGVIMLAGIFYGSMYGGSTTSILVNIPGEAASVITCLDGHKMALKGRAGPALGIAAFGSFIAGTLGLIGLILVANPLATVAVAFGPAEYFSLMCLGLSILIYLTQGSILRGLAMAGFGIFLSLVGQDLNSGKPRFTFGLQGLVDGIGMVPLVMGLFGISEVLLNLESRCGKNCPEHWDQ